MIYTTTQLVAAVKRNASLPSSQLRLPDTDIIALLNEELQLTITTELINLKQSYMIHYVDIPLVASQNEYDMPQKAIGWAMWDIGYINTDENYMSLPQIDIQQIDRFNIVETSTHPTAVYLKNDKIVCIPTISSSASGSLRVYYHRKQNELVSVSSAGKITTVSTTDTDYVCTVDTIPSYTDGIDVISGTSPFGVIAEDQTVTVAGFVITIPIDDFTRPPVINDYVCPVGRSVIANIPEDWHPILAMSAALRGVEVTGNVKGLQILQGRFALMIKSLRDIGKSRIAGAPKKIIGKHHILNRMRSAHNVGIPGT